MSSVTICSPSPYHPRGSEGSKAEVCCLTGKLLAAGWRQSRRGGGMDWEASQARVGQVLHGGIAVPRGNERWRRPGHKRGRTAKGLEFESDCTPGIHRVRLGRNDVALGYGPKDNSPSGFVSRAAGRKVRAADRRPQRAPRQAPGPPAVSAPPVVRREAGGRAEGVESAPAAGLDPRSAGWRVSSAAEIDCRQLHRAAVLRHRPAGNLHAAIREQLRELHVRERIAPILRRDELTQQGANRRGRA
jgi:hypothetical protein